VLALPYWLLGAVFWQLVVQDRGHRVLVGALLVVAAALAVVPAFLSGTRAVEIAAARWLLQVDLPDPPQGPGPARMSLETRMRAVLWFAVHMVVGSVIGALALTALPLALTFLVYQLAGQPDELIGPPLNLFDANDTVVVSAIGVALLILVGYAVAGLGALAATMAPVLLGPSQTERIAALEVEAAKLAGRNRLARELHDSIGHALTVATLQAAAARELLDTDVSFVRRALTAIEDTGRTAMADLDHVLGVLRDGDSADRAPHRTLADIDQLVAEVRATGVLVNLDVAGTLEGMPAVVSREGYRIVQESLTNALRHAGPVAVTLRLRIDESSLRIELTNPVPADQRPAADIAAESSNGHMATGRGLVGMRERVNLLGGELTVGPQRDSWRVDVRLPIKEPS
jgi:signal transduction histidine kinase